jgi:HK97 family phage portal protein
LIFPELRRRLKEFSLDRGELLSLNLKSTPPGLTFSTTTEMEFYRKYPSLMAALGGGAPAYSGETVSRDSALSHTVVWACYRLVSETIGRLPASLMVKTADGKREAADHPMFRAMHDEPNPEISARGFKSMLTGHCMLDGDAFARIHRRSGTEKTALELEPLLPDNVEIEREKTGQKRIVYHILNEFGGRDGSYVLERDKPQDILHLRGLSWSGLRGHNILRIGRQSVGTALGQERNVGRFWATGGRKPAWIQVEDNPFATDEELKQYGNDFRAYWADPHRVPLVEKGLKLESEGFTMMEAQALESRQWTVSDISRLWLISPHLVGDLSRATFSNIEQLFLEFKTITISDWTNLWEQDFNRCVLTPKEKASRHFLHFNLNAFLIGDFKTRMAGHAIAIQNGILNVDEVREVEDKNKLPKGAGQSYRFQLNMQTTPGTGVPTASEQRILAEVNQGDQQPNTEEQKP